MTPQELVPTLELCKELKKYVKLETCFYWKPISMLDGTTKYALINQKSAKQYLEGKVFDGARVIKLIPAPTASELGEVLPTGFISLPFGDQGMWTCEDIDVFIEPAYKATIEEKSEANARCKMAIYLYKNKLMKGKV